MFRFNFHTHDRSGNYVPWDIAYNILQSCEPNAILFTNVDNDTFTLWYLQEVENVRKDVRVVNLSLLNTGWYVMQLKYKEPVVPINYPDEKIKKLGGYINLPSKKSIIIKIGPQLNRYYMKEMEGLIPFSNNNIEMKFDIKPNALNGTAIRSQDYMIFEILQSFNFEKPLYFSITVSPDNVLGLNEYLRNDGFAFKVLTVKGHRIAPEILKRNITEKFRYRNLNNPNVYYNEETIRLLQNFRKGFLDLAFYDYNNKNYKKTLETLDKMFEMMPEEVIPIRRNEILETIGKIYYQLGKPEKFEKILDKLIKRDISDSKKREYVNLYFHMKNNNKAINLLKELYDKNPENDEFFSSLIKLLEIEKDFKNAIDYLDKWLTTHPNDMNAVNKREEYLKRINPEQDSLHK